MRTLNQLKKAKCNENGFVLVERQELRVLRKTKGAITKGRWEVAVEGIIYKHYPTVKELMRELTKERTD